MKVKLRDFFASIHILLIIGLVILIVENSFILPAVIVSNFDFLTFIFFAIIATAIMVTYYMYGISEHTLRRTIVIFALVGLILILNSIFVIIQPDIFTFTHNRGVFSGIISVDISMEDRARSIILMVIALLFLIIILIVVPLKKSSRNSLKYIAVFFIVGMYVLIGYSLYNEIDIYRRIFEQGYIAHIPYPKALFVNQNLFASHLFLGFIFTLYLRSTMGRYKNLMWLVALPFVAFIILTYSKTKILLVGLILLAYLITFIVQNFKKHKVTMLVVTFVIFALVSVVITFYFVPALENTKLGLFLHKFLPDELFKFGSIQSRADIWGVAWSSITHDWRNFFFGQGQYISKLVLGKGASDLDVVVVDTTWGNFHSGYLEIWASLGLVGLLLYFALIIYIIYVDFRILKYNKPFGMFSLIVLGAFLLHSSIESISLLIFNAEGIWHGLPVVVPQLVYYNQIKQEEKRLLNRHGLTKDAVYI